MNTIKLTVVALALAVATPAFALTEEQEDVVRLAAGIAFAHDECSAFETNPKADLAMLVLIGAQNPKADEYKAALLKARAKLVGQVGSIPMPRFCELIYNHWLGEPHIGSGPGWVMRRK